MIAPTEVHVVRTSEGGMREAVVRLLAGPALPVLEAQELLSNSVYGESA